MKNVIKDIYRFTKKYLNDQLLGIFISMLSIITLTVCPYATKYIIDTVLISKSKNEVIKGILIFLAICLLNPFFEYIKEILYMNLNQKIIFDLCKDLFNCVINSPLNFFNHSRKGEIISRIINDSSLASNVIKDFFTTIINNILLITMFFIAMFFISYKITFIILILYVLFIVTNLKLSDKFENLSKKSRQNTDLIFNNLSQMIDTIESIKSFSLEEYSNKKFVENLSNFKKYNTKLSKLRIFLSTLGNLYELFSISLVYGLGGLEIINGTLTIGDVIGLGIYFQMLKWPIEELISSNVNLNSSIPIFERINEYMNLEQEYRTGLNDLNFSESVQIKNLGFKYEEKNDFVFKNVNLTLPEKGLVAILGESGRGKSTFVKLLLKFYIPNEGEILIGSKNISDLGVDTLRKNIGYVSQDVILFNDTIENNIKCDNDIPYEEIEAMCKLFNLHNKIVNLENKYQTILNERLNLSGGEKQRLGIIRALCKSTKILILDEPTASLDTENEVIVDNALKQLSENKLIIVISHKNHIVNLADKVIYLNKDKFFEEINYDSESAITKK